MDARTRAAKIRAATMATVHDRNRMLAKADKELVELYAHAADVIIAHINTAKNNDDRVGLDKLAVVLQAVQTQSKLLAAKRNDRLNEHITQAAKLGASVFNADISSAQVFGVNHGAAAFVRGFVANDGLQLSDRLWRLDRGVVEQLRDHIQHAVIHGESAYEAMARSMGAGKGVPHDIAQAYSASKTGALGSSVRSLMTGAKDPSNGKGVVYQAMRLFRTEITRAHGEAYMSAGLQTDGVVGVKFNLSPNHRKQDVCDVHASADLYGLGAGVYPTRDACPWPAHPNTFSYVTAVFDYEIEDAKKEAIKAPVHDNAPNAPIAPDNTSKKDMGRHSVDALIERGAKISERLLQGGDHGFLERLHNELKAQRPADHAVAVSSRGAGADLIKQASRMYPKSWVQASENAGRLFTKLNRSGRGFHVFSNHDFNEVHLEGYGFLKGVKKGDGVIVTSGFSTSVHEFAHRLQRTVGGLDDVFQSLHQRRTAGDALEKLKDLIPDKSYGKDEVTRKDNYISPYFGKVYNRDGGAYLGLHGALEVMPMAFQHVLSGRPLDMRKLADNDRELFDLTIGALFHYDP